MPRFGFSPWVLLTTVAALVTQINGMVEPIPMPDNLAECYKFRTTYFNISVTPTQEINSYCITKYLYQTTHLRNHRPIANETYLYAQELFRRLIGESGRMRKKRQTRMRRQEIRTLSRAQWRRFVNRVNALKGQMVSETLSRYDSLAELHRGVTLSAHDGPAFLGWHTIYLLVFQIALGVPVPYWDSRLDYYMENPTDSVIWTPDFFGTGFGTVDDGPFGNWQTIEGVPLIRNIGNDGTLISEPAIDTVLSLNSHADIVEPNPVAENSLEGHHNGPHVWVDGQLSAPATASQDPIFFMHHAFIDYIWRLFRTRLRTLGVDPSSDYPPTNVRQHGPNDRLIPWRLRNVDAYHNYFERFSSYAPSPTCPNCAGSTYLQCINERCVSVVGVVSVAAADGVASFASRAASSRQMAVSPSAGGTARVMMTAEQVGPLRIGPRFRSPFTDTRTRNDPLPSTAAIMRRSVNYKNDSINITADFRMDRERTYQNTFVINGVSDIKLWAFVPVRVIFEKVENLKANAPNLLNGSTDQSSGFYRVGSNNNGKQISVNNLQAKYPRCRDSKSAAFKIFVQSDGMDYSGRHKDYVFVDEAQFQSSAIVYIGVKNPTTGSSKAYITAYDSCGRVCRVRCLVNGDYQPCSGAFIINTKIPLMYGNTQEDAAKLAWAQSDLHNSVTHTRDVPIVFECEFNGEWPWTYV